MPLFQTLLIGGTLLIVAGGLMFVRQMGAGTRLAIALGIGLVASGLSAAVSEEKLSGTQTLISRGYPKHFHFETGGRSGVNTLYFAGNTVVHFGAFALLLSLLPRKMPARMLFLRISLGILFFILGIVGSLLPVLQGWIFFLLSFLLFFPRNKMTQKILVKAEPKLPRVVAWLRRLGIGEP